MKKNLCLVLSLILLLALVRNSNAEESRDFYLWNTISFQVPLDPAYYFKAKTKNYYLTRDQIRTQTYLDLSLYRKMNDWLKLGLAFRGAQDHKELGDVYEYRPQFVTVIGLHSQTVKYTTTNRIDYRMLTGGNKYFRYYHNSFVHFPSFGKLPKPYIGEELFFKLNGAGLHLARLFGGLHVMDHEQFDIDVFYSWQDNKSGDEWGRADILGLNLIFQL